MCTSVTQSHLRAQVAHVIVGSGESALELGDLRDEAVGLVAPGAGERSLVARFVFGRRELLAQLELTAQLRIVLLGAGLRLPAHDSRVLCERLRKKSTMST